MLFVSFVDPDPKPALFSTLLPRTHFLVADEKFIIDALIYRSLFVSAEQSRGFAGALTWSFSPKLIAR